MSDSTLPTTAPASTQPSAPQPQWPGGPAAASGAAVELSPAQAGYHWFVLIVGMVGCGLCFNVIEPWLLAATGGFGPTLLQAASPGPAVAAMGLALLVSMSIAATVARLLKSPGKGLVVLGVGLGVLALRLQGVETIAFSGSLSLLAIEGLIWTVVVLFIACGLWRAGGDLGVVHPRPGQDTTQDWARSSSAGVLVACGLAALPVAWLVAQSPMRGQALAAALLGCVATGVVGRLAAPHIQPILLVMAPVLAATLAQFVLMTMIPSGEAATLFVQGNFPHLLIPVPLDWVAGALIGVPWGLLIGNAFLNHEPRAGESVVITGGN